MASIIKVDRILDSTELGKVDIPGGVETSTMNATELVADTWKNVDGTENYKCRAWVNFDGTTTPPTIRASGNVSSVVRNGVGDYTINFETAMEDANYIACPIGGEYEGSGPYISVPVFADASGIPYGYTYTYIRVKYATANGAYSNNKTCGLAIFR